MPRLTAVATAVPQYRVDQDEARTFAATMFGSRVAEIDRLLPLFDNAGIRTRYFSMPVEWFGEEHRLEEKNRIYIESATDLGARSCRAVLTGTDTKAEQIDYIIYINTTGLATPSIDARLINVLGMRRNVRRTPIWGLGCAGGAAGLSHAYHYLLGHPGHRVLVVAVELCGLTFIHDDYSKSNLVACALFGEGAAAALICGDEVASAGLDILDTQSNFYPDSLNVMGWNIVSRGMQVVFDKRIPDIVSSHAARELDSFLTGHQTTKDDIRHFLYHPGGMKVVDAYEHAYGTNGDRFALSREVLRDYGNMSSVTVLFVIARYLEKYGATGSGYGVISALGPGFCSESLLVDLAMRRTTDYPHIGDSGQRGVRSSVKQGGVRLS
jgi:alkylresorcinol/alkylpyrone synthase